MILRNLKHIFYSVTREIIQGRLGVFRPRASPEARAETLGKSRISPTPPEKSADPRPGEGDLGDV